jgi:hypothetical protein
MNHPSQGRRLYTRPMRRLAGKAGGSLASIGLASAFGYLIAVITANVRHPPLWPYLLFGGVATCGVALYVIDHAFPRGPSVEDASPRQASPPHRNAAPSSDPIDRTFHAFLIIMAVGIVLALLALILAGALVAMHQN